MAFTQLNLQTQSLLESTFIGDMRIIINANTTLLKNSVQDMINALEIDPVTKTIGVDNALSSIWTNNIRLSNQLLFTDGNTTIGSLTKAAGKSVLEVDQVNIKAGGSILALGAASKLAVTRLGVGVSNLAALATDGLVIGSSSSITVDGAMKANNSIQHSFETVSLTMTAVAGSPNTYECDVTLNATSKQNIQLALAIPATSSALNSSVSNNAAIGSGTTIIVNVYTNATTPPLKGQEFNFMVSSILGSDNAAPNSNWAGAATIRISGGHDATKNRAQFNQQSAAATAPATIAGPYLKFTSGLPYAGCGTLTAVGLVNTANNAPTNGPMRFITISTAGLCTVAQS